MVAEKLYFLFEKKVKLKTEASLPTSNPFQILPIFQSWCEHLSSTGAQRAPISESSWFEYPTKNMTIQCHLLGKLVGPPNPPLGNPPTYESAFLLLTTPHPAPASVR